MPMHPLMRAALPALAIAFTMGAAGTAHASTKKKTHTTSMSRSKLQGYKTESEAKSACGSSTVVWHASGSKVFHTAKSRYFGKTKRGAYVCEKAAMADKLHEAKN